MKNNIWGILSLAFVAISIVSWMTDVYGPIFFETPNYSILMFNTHFTNPIGVILGVIGLIKDPKSIISIIGILLNVVLSIFPFVMIFFFGI
jgi:hypothetical protein